LSNAVMARICEPKKGLFPKPSEMKFSCSCPDWAGMCKHVAAVLYGVGARFDQQPELVFRLRGVDEKQLVFHATTAGADIAKPAKGKRLEAADSDLAGMFGIDMAVDAAPPPAKKKAVKRPK
jgi:uncharacterized Zn finger protein